MNIKKDKRKKSIELLGKDKVIINIGLSIFRDSLLSQKIEVIDVNWKPPRETQEDMSSLIDDLL